METQHDRKEGSQKMPTFTVTGAKQLAELVTPLSEDASTAIFDFMGSSERVYAAICVKDNEGNKGKWAIHLVDYGYFYMCTLDEYHPRLNGKAEIVIRET